MPRPIRRNALRLLRPTGTELRERIKEAGGFWDREKKLWRLSRSHALQMGLEKRIVDTELDF